MHITNVICVSSFESSVSNARPITFHGVHSSLEAFLAVPLPAETRRGLNSIGYLEHDYSKFHTVLDDIHQFRPDVRLEDLLPHTYGVVFRKIDKNNQLDMNRAQELIDNVHLSSGSSLSTRASKKIAKFFFGPWR